MWFLHREEADAELAEQVQRRPDLSYQVMPNGCGPDAWGIEVRDANGILITEAYSPGDPLPPPIEPAARRR